MDPWLNAGEQPGSRQEKATDLRLEVAQVGEQPRLRSQTLQCCDEKSILVHLHFLWFILLLALSCERVGQTLRSEQMGLMGNGEETCPPTGKKTAFLYYSYEMVRLACVQIDLVRVRK